MNIVSVIGLIIAILILVIGAYKGLGALPVTLLAAFAAIVTNAPSFATLFQTTYFWDSFAKTYIGGYTSAYTSYLLMFSFSALYTVLMQKAGAPQKIAYKLIEWFGRKSIILVSVVVISILTYGGVSLLVVVFAVAPLMFTLFDEKNIPRHLTMGCLSLGATTYTMTCLPGTIQLTNVVPTEFLGTTLTAAPILGILCAIAIFSLGYVYLLREEKKAIAAGETFEYPANYKQAEFDVHNPAELPSTFGSFAPMVILLGFIILFSQLTKANSIMISTYATILGSVAVVVLNLDRFKKVDWIEVFNNGLEGGIEAIGGMAAVLAFGAVVKSTPAFTTIVSYVLSIDMHPYVRGIVSTMTFSAITGSSSGGLRITLEALRDVLVNSGVNLNTLHRLMVISADALDTLPHSPGLFVMFSVLGVTHKTAYKHVFFTSTLISFVVVWVATIVCAVFGI